MREAKLILALWGLALAVTAIAGCATTAALPPPPPPAPVPVEAAVEPTPPDDWNVFPDPLTGRVEVYHKGVSVGSITGDETEDPPIPEPRKGDDPDQP